MASVVLAWALGVAAVVLTRLRGEWEFYRGWHRWAAEWGVPDYVRNADGLVVFAGAACVGAWLVARWSGGSAGGLLGLRRGVSGWGWMVLAALAPMVVGGLVLGWTRWMAEGAPVGVVGRVVGGVVRAPIGEELLFRGLLVGVSAVALGWRGVGFWVNAVAAALLFASIHVAWNVEALGSGWPTLLVTAAGGVWYAWLLARWGALWVPMVMHAGMNLGWLLAAAGGGAGGGGWSENVLRAATIGIATWWTVRATRGREVEAWR